MKKACSVQITVANPCSQSWDEMVPADNGRHCAHCAKDVIDFTTWSDAALFRFFSKENSGVCGRFFETQLDKPILIPYQPNSRLYRIVAALGLTLVFAQSPSAFAQNKPPKAEQSSIIKQQPDTLGNQFGTLKGNVIDEQKEPLINAAVRVFQNEILKGVTVTDYDGHYAIKPLEPGKYTVVISFEEYDTITLHDIIIAKDWVTAQNVQMKRGPVTMHRVIKQRGARPLIKGKVRKSYPR